MKFFVRIDIPEAVARPGIPVAQVLREMTPVIETMIPLVSGRLPHRLTGETLAEWTVEQDAVAPQ